jgi:hypothetical protein
MSGGMPSQQMERTLQELLQEVRELRREVRELRSERGAPGTAHREGETRQ